MNKYGYFIYRDYPRQLQRSDLDISATFAGQIGSSDILLLDAVIPNGYSDWADFEPNRFNFSRLVFTGDPESKMAYTSDLYSTADGTINNCTVIVGCRNPVSGSGITLRTYNDYYQIEIVLEDANGMRSKIFEKNEDEYYPFVFDGLRSFSVRFIKISPYSHIKIIGFMLGRILKLNNNILVGEPEIVNNFSLRNDTLEYDTLTMTVIGRKSDFNVITGSEVIYSRNGKTFYVNSATYNEDGTITISAYDHIARLEQKRFDGMAGFQNTNNGISKVLSGAQTFYRDGEYQEETVVRSDVPDSQTFTNILQPSNCRDVLRQLLLGNFACLRKTNNKNYEVIRPTEQSPIEMFFTENEIVSVPNVEYGDKIHKLTLNLKYSDGNGEFSEVFRGEIPPNEERTFIYDNVGTNRVYYVSGQTPTGEDVLTIVNRMTSQPPYFTSPKETLSVMPCVNTYPAGTVFVVTRNNSDTVDVPISYTNSDIPLQFKDNDVEISDCDVRITNGESALINYLYHLYSHVNKVTFDSIQEAIAGQRVQVSFDDMVFLGWITRKTERLNGVYSYEVMCL